MALLPPVGGEEGDVSIKAPHPPRLSDRPGALRGLRFALGVVLRAAPLQVALDALMTLAEALAPLAVLQGTRELLSELAAGHSPWSGLLLVGIGEAVPAFGSRVLYGPVGAALGRRIEAVLRPRVMTALATMPWTTLEDPEVQKRLARLDEGLTAVEIVWDSGFALVRDVGRGLSALAFLATVSPWAALAAGVALVPAVLLRRAAAAEWEGVRLANLPAQRLAGYLFGLLTGRDSAAEVRLFGYAAHVRERWRRALGVVQRAELTEQARTALRGQLAATAGTALVLVAASLVLVGRAGAPATASGLLALLTAFRQTADLGYWVGSLAEEDAHAANLAEVLSWGSPMKPWPAPRRLRRVVALAGRLPELPRSPDPVAALRGVTFTYRGQDRPAVQDLSLEIRAGECLALVGPNGSGKTTLARVLVGLLEPSSGHLVADGGPSLRRSAVLQDFMRYELSVRENVGLGDVSRMNDDPAIGEAIARGVPWRRPKAGWMRCWGGPPGRGGTFPVGNGRPSAPPGASWRGATCWCWTSRPRPWTRWRSGRCSTVSRSWPRDGSR